ncbi:MAG: hypothetical protein ABW168_21250 [Sedimenticola sp.]
MCQLVEQVRSLVWGNDETIFEVCRQGVPCARLTIPLSNACQVKVELHLFRPPAKLGEINSYLLTALSGHLGGNDAVTVVDFAPKPIMEVAGLGNIPRSKADDVAILDPLDDRVYALFGSLEAPHTKATLIGLANACDRLGHPLSAELISDLTSLLESSHVEQKLTDLLTWSTFDDDKKRSVVGKFPNTDSAMVLLERIGKALPPERVMSLFSNPLFVRGISYPTLWWDKQLFFIHLNLEHISLADAQWITETALTSRMRQFDAMSLFVIDDDMHLSGLERAAQIMCSEFIRGKSLTIQLFVQCGPTEQDRVCELPAADDKVAKALPELSRLKYARDSAFVGKEQEYYVEDEAIKSLIRNAYLSKKGDKGESTEFFFRSLNYERIKEATHLHPLGIVEDVTDWLTPRSTSKKPS